MTARLISPRRRSEIELGVRENYAATQIARRAGKVTTIYVVADELTIILRA